MTRERLKRMLKVNGQMSNVYSMHKSIIYISYKLPDAWLAQLKKHCALIVHKKQTPPSRAEFLAQSKKADAVLAILNEKIDASFFKQCPNIKLVANYAIGCDNIDLAAAKKYNVPVSNTPGDFASSVSEHAMALLLAVSKHIVTGDVYMRAGKYKFWDPMLMLGADVREKILGIVGVGRIGSGLVKIASAGFDMRILYHDISAHTQLEKAYGAKKVSLKELLKQSDFVSLHVPLLPSTRHIIGTAELGLMKKTAYIINTSRGAVIDEKALVSALRKKQIAGAGLDVYEYEPRMSAGLAKLENVVLTPHIASATECARRHMAEIAVENLLDVLVRGKRPRNLVE